MGVVGVAFLWIRPLGSSLWLDETGTFWVIQGGLGEVFERALDFQGQFPLYHVLMWGWTRLVGTSEIALRLPSVVAAALAAWLCYRLALRLMGRVHARLAGCIFVLLPPVAFAAGDARPYALALAALLGATLAMVRWLESEERGTAIAYLVLAAVTLYLHYLFALALIPHALFASRARRADGRRAVPVVVFAVAALMLLLVPAIPHFLEVVRRRHAMSLFTYGSISDLLTWIVPPSIILAFLAGFFARFFGEAPQAGSTRVRGEILPFLGLWLVLPATALYVAGSVTGIGLYAERHFLSSVPALALLSAAVFAMLPFRGQQIAIIVLAFISIVTLAGPYHTPWPSDWRAASSAANATIEGSDTPILIYSGFSESRDMDWILDEERSRLFLAPLAAYPVEGLLFPLPFELTEEAREYVSRVLADVVPHAEQIVLMSTELGETYDVWLAERSAILGYRERTVGNFGDVRVVVYER